MKIIDRYLIKQFLLTIVFGILAFTLIFVIVDLMENLDDFMDQNVPASIIFYYYMVFTPEIMKLMIPVSVLFGGLFTTGKMANLNELTAIKSSGVSFYRYMLPIVIATIFISGFSVYFGGYVVPEAIKKKIELEVRYLKRGHSVTGVNIYFQDSKYRIVSIHYFDAGKNEALRASIQEFSRSDVTQMVSRLDMQRMVYDSTKNNWVGYQGVYREFDSTGHSIEYFDQRDISDLNFYPRDLMLKQQKLEEMDLGELIELIEDQKRSGHDARRVEIELHQRFSFGVASLVVILFGLPLSANRRRTGLALQFGINILITFIYLAFMQIVGAFGKNGALDPVLTAWLSNMLFFAAAVVNLARIKQ